jgi:HupE / UreJ protein
MALGLLAVICASVLRAHDIPSDVTVQAFVRPEGRSLTLVVRVPLKAMRDVNFPLRGSGFLDVPKADQFLDDAAVLWIAGNVEIFEGDVRLGTPRVGGARVSLPSDRSFDTYAHALQHVSGPPLPGDTEIPWDQAMLDVVLDYPIASDLSRFSIRPAFARLGLRVVTVLRFLPPAGAVRAFEFSGDPGLVFLDPRWHQAAFRFVRLGFVHILSGTDHLLFLLCLVIPLRRIKPLVVVITAFTAAHSVTLIAAALGAGPDGLWFPPLVEMLIAVSILYLALENIVLASSATDGPVERRVPRWSIAFAFGLVHGFGFSFALRESLQFAGSHLLTSLVSFNVGVELGQLTVLAIMVPAFYVLFNYLAPVRVGTIIMSALVAHTALHWTGERWSRVRQFEWSAPDPGSLLGLVRVLILLLLAAGAAWAILSLARKAGRARLVSEQRERGT